MTDNLPERTALPGDFKARERLYLALLDLAPHFVVPCRVNGARRDITVSRHRSGLAAPWVWAIHRLGAGMATYVWDGKHWTVAYDPVRMLEHAAWQNPLEAICEAQRISAADVERGRTEVEYLDD